MPSLETLHSQLGLMTWPLSLLSLLTVMLLLERSLYILLNSRLRCASTIRQLYQLAPSRQHDLSQLAEQWYQQRNMLKQALGMLLNHRYLCKSLREETAQIWLAEKRRQLGAGVRVLGIIGVISPLIGLLGTVLGLIAMFNGLAEQGGNVDAASLADGLGLAMGTTAAGLMIALPAIVGAQACNLWAESCSAKLEHALNHANLYLEGIDLNRLSCEQECPQQQSCCSDSAEKHTSGTAHNPLSEETA
ncbi:MULTISPECIES: MotA/TolQ/ExbB proton channel family protein [Aliagarivorans]|uniref:MotA/TolQ/ExbB proton channel family protein n=1 Tax=Aliagarivorans TaxID=882379 RepID=UPI00041A6C00|nr:MULTISPECIES: MotA/TolQ/ExbB proton channel family protein [Aliagarivorans]